MRAHSRSKRTPWGDAWCRRCGRASRVGQWISHRDACPHCGACGHHRVSWALLRLYHPEWPLRPILGHHYLRDPKRRRGDAGASNPDQLPGPERGGT